MNTKKRKKFVIDRVGFNWSGGNIHLRRMDDPGQEYGTNKTALCFQGIFPSDKRNFIVKDGRVQFDSVCVKCKQALQRKQDEGYQIVLARPKNQEDQDSYRPEFPEIKTIPLGFRGTELNQNQPPI